MKFHKNNKGPHLVIVPKSTLHNWVSEFNKWIPEFNVFMFHGNKEERVSLNIQKTFFNNLLILFKYINIIIFF